MQQTSDMFIYSHWNNKIIYIYIYISLKPVFALEVVFFKNVDSREGEPHTLQGEDDEYTCTDGATKLASLTYLIKWISCLNLKRFFTGVIFHCNIGILYILLITWLHEQIESRT